MFNHLQTFPNLCENYYLMQLMSFFNLEVLKRELKKSKWIMNHIKLWKNMLLKQTKITTHMDLWKYGEILNIQKSSIIMGLKLSNKIFLIWIYHIVLHHILNPNNKFGMWINKKNSFCDGQIRQPSIFFDFKSPLLLTNEFSINK